MKLFFVLMLISNFCHAVTLSSLAKDSEQPIVIIDKANTRIAVYVPSTKTVTISPALIGKVKSDFFDVKLYDKKGKSNGITPSGEFVLKKSYSTHLKTDIIIFIEGKSSVVAIHPVWLGSIEQHRKERLESLTTEDNRISNGCVNVPEDFFYGILNVVPNNTRMFILNEGESLDDDITNNITAQLSVSKPNQ